jgi:hypothetical protein
MSPALIYAATAGAMLLMLATARSFGRHASRSYREVNR